MDPQGLAIKSALETQGLRSLGRVSQGKYFIIEFEDGSKGKIERDLERVCRDVLSNPVIEDYTYEIS
jgi:phosphoribosylformylglycinamidine synthase